MKFSKRNSMCVCLSWRLSRLSLSFLLFYLGGPDHTSAQHKQAPEELYWFFIEPRGPSVICIEDAQLSCGGYFRCIRQSARRTWSKGKLKEEVQSRPQRCIINIIFNCVCRSLHKAFVARVLASESRINNNNEMCEWRSLQLLSHSFFFFFFFNPDSSAG